MIPRFLMDEHLARAIQAQLNDAYPKMDVRDYFDFVDENTIKMKGHHLGIERVLEDYLQGAHIGDIRQRYQNLAVDEIHAAILYYLANKEEMTAYLQRVKARDPEAWQQRQRKPDPFLIGFRALLEERSKSLSSV